MTDHQRKLVGLAEAVGFNDISLCFFAEPGRECLTITNSGKVLLTDWNPPLLNETMRWPSPDSVKIELNDPRLKGDGIKPGGLRLQ